MWDISKKSTNKYSNNHKHMNTINCNNKCKKSFGVFIRSRNMRFASGPKVMKYGGKSIANYFIRLLNRFLSFVATDGKDWDGLKPTLYLLSFYKDKDLPSRHHLNSKTNGPVLLIKIEFRLWPVAKDGQDGDGLKPAFSSFNAKCKNHRNIVMDSVPWWNQIDIYLL